MKGQGVRNHQKLDKSKKEVEDAPFNIRQSRWPMIFTSALTVVVFYGYIFETDCLPSNAVKRMNELSS